MGEDQGDRLGVLVDDEGQQVLAVDLLEEAEGEGLDRLADRVERGVGGLAQRPLDERSGHVEPPLSAGQRVGVGMGEVEDCLLLLFGGDGAELGDLDGDRLDLFRPQPPEQLCRLLLGEAGEEDRGFTDVGGCHGFADCLFSTTAETGGTRLFAGPVSSAGAVRLERDWADPGAPAIPRLAGQGAATVQWRA